MLGLMVIQASALHRRWSTILAHYEDWPELMPVKKEEDAAGLPLM